MFEGLFQPMHLLVIALIALIVLGPRKLPELGRGLGDGIREFKKSITDMSATNGTGPASEGGKGDKTSDPAPEASSNS